jgi:anti-anti-sigma regulatory factor
MSQIYKLEGEIVGPNTWTHCARSRPLPAERTKVEIDCSHLRRMDFVSAGTLFNIVSQLHTQGRLVVLTGVNSMVAALMQVMGLHQVARIELRG